MDCILRRLLTPVPMMDRAGSPVSDDEQRSQGFGSCQERLHAYAADPARISVCARWRRPPRLPSRIQFTPSLETGGQAKCHSITPQITSPYLTHHSDRSPGLDSLFPHAFTMIAVWSRVPGRLLNPPTSVRRTAAGTVAEVEQRCATSRHHDFRPCRTLEQSAKSAAAAHLSDVRRGDGRPVARVDDSLVVLEVRFAREGEVSIGLEVQQRRLKKDLVRFSRR